jgi:hypothetical protein
MSFSLADELKASNVAVNVVFPAAHGTTGFGRDGRWLRIDSAFAPRRCCARPRGAAGAVPRQPSHVSSVWLGLGSSVG